MKEHDAVDKLILKAADIMEKQGNKKNRLGTPNGPVCIYASLLVAEGARGETFQEHLFLRTSEGEEEAVNRLERGFHTHICAFNNVGTRGCDYIVACMRAIANGEPIPAELVAA